MSEHTGVKVNRRVYNCGIRSEQNIAGVIASVDTTPKRPVHSKSIFKDRAHITF